LRFGKRLRELRKLRGLTQQQLADRAGISFTYVSKLETGALPPPRERTILALAMALDSEPDELFGLAEKIPRELLRKVDGQTIRMLRSLDDHQEARKRGSKSRRPSIADRPASGLDGSGREEASGCALKTFQALVEDSLDGIVILGPKLEGVYQNPATEGILGYRMGDLLGEDVLGLVHPDEMRKTAHRLSAVAQTPGDSDRAHLRVKHKDGTWHAIDVWAKNLLNIPAVKGIIICFRDISGRLGVEGAQAKLMASSLTAKEYHLTDTELSILALLTKGYGNAKIAGQMVVSPSTVRFHITNILRKLGAANRTEAAGLAVRRHLVN
jgi:PAS domain S-box-containing protein